jgi:HD-GYP domain-containing protein (c-di-GMP phosphodiesterase class II)
MTTNRPYRRAMEAERAIDELKLNSGTQFHPRVVEVLTSLLAGSRDAGGGPSGRTDDPKLAHAARESMAASEPLSRAPLAAP